MSVGQCKGSRRGKSRRSSGARVAGEWMMFPSATYGGKPGFWVRRIGDVRQSVVWDRWMEKWVLNFNGELVAYFKNDRDAKLAADKEMAK